MERVKCAAIKFADEDGEVVLVEDDTHYGAVKTTLRDHPQWVLERAVDGYVTSEGRFVGRTEGYRIAERAGQLRPNAWVEEDIDSMELLSEDLYED